MKHYYLLLLFFSGGIVQAQNLVPNPSFEDTLECPDFPGQVWRAEGWYVAENTPDYYNCCCNQSFPKCGVPQNQFSFRYASSGVAYCGIYTYISFPPVDFQEKVGVELASALVIGKKYFVSMAVSSISTYENQVSNGSHNKLGFLFSTNKYDMSNRPPNNNFAHFSSDSIITDTVGWSIIRGSFVADSSYRFLSIGNFFDNNHVDTIRYWYINGNNALAAYYFIDDVCVTTDSIGCDFTSSYQGYCSLSTGSYLPESLTKINIYPNPVSDRLQIETEFDCIGHLETCNLSGEVLTKQKIPVGKHKSIIDVSGFEEGFFLIKISDNRNNYFKKFVVQR